MLAASEQPAADNFPLVSPPRLEFQERGALVLKFAKEPQRIAGGGCPAIDRMSLKPTPPFASNQQFALDLVSRRASSPHEAGPEGLQLVALALLVGSIRERWIGIQTVPGIRRADGTVEPAI